MVSSLSRKKHSKWFLNMEELKDKVGLCLGSGKNNNVWKCFTLQLILALCFKMLPSALSGFVLTCNFFREDIFSPSSCLLGSSLLGDTF